MHKRIAIIGLLLSSSFAFSDLGLIEQNGFFTSIGAGFAPIYIEEATQNKVLIAGATVTALHSSLQVGSVFKNNYAAYVLAEHNWYIDSDRNVYVAGLTGLGATYLVPDFYQVYLSAGAGLATKMVIGEDNLATGWGVHLGLGRPLNQHIALDVSYSFLQLSSTTMPSADAEAISSLQLAISYRWF